MAQEKSKGSNKPRQPKKSFWDKLPFRSEKITTRTGKTIKINRSLSDRAKAKKDERSRAKAAYLATMPKSRLKRFFFRLHPKRVAKYWFSRQGLIMALKITGIGAFVGFIAALAVFAYFRKDLPDLRNITADKFGGSVRYYDRTGQTLLWEDTQNINRTPVKEDQINDHMKDAIVAIEDRDFYKHGGFNMRGIVRAALNNVKGGGTTQGASTITQQYIKLSEDWTEERTFSRKIKELILSVELERNYSKKEILAGYLNLAPFGKNIYGVEAAAQSYFNKPAKDLTIDESAFLAALPQSPSRYSPYIPNYNKEGLINRQHYILDIMAELGFIKSEERDAAKKTDTLAKVQPLKPSQYAGIKAPYFVMAAKDELAARFGEKVVQKGGWKVTTTLDLNAQKIAEEEAAKGIRQIERQGGDTLAFTAEDVKTGQMLAQIGGINFGDEKKSGYTNFATTKLAPGSSIKVYDYSALMSSSNKWGAGSVLFDSQGPLEGYPCTNKATPEKGGNCLFDYDRHYPGPLTIRYAIGASKNVPAVKAFLLAGKQNVIDLAEKMGLRDGYNCYEDTAKTIETTCGAAAGIGDGAYLKLDQHVNGYATLARNGLYVPQTYIIGIKDNNNKSVFEWKQNAGEQVLDPDIAYIIGDITSDPNASYLTKKIHRYKDFVFSVKTGTTNDAKDGWMMGFSNQIAAGVWVGHHTNTMPMSGGMDTMTAPIWSGFMNRMHDSLKSIPRVKPASVKSLPAFVVTNRYGAQVVPSPANDLYPGKYEQPKKNNGKSIIDVVSGKLATDCTPTLARKELSNNDPTYFSGDTFYNKNTNTQESDDVHHCDDAKPTVSLVITGGNGTYKFTANVTKGTYPMTNDGRTGKVTFSIDGQVLSGGSFELNDSGSVSYDYTATDSGTKTVKVEVVDSVYYSGSDESTETFTAASSESSSPLTLTTAKINGANTRFVWANNDGVVTVYRYSDNSILCSGSNVVDDDCTTLIANAPVGTKVYARDTTNKSSSLATVSN